MIWNYTLISGLFGIVAEIYIEQLLKLVQGFGVFSSTFNCLFNNLPVNSFKMVAISLF